MVMSSLPSVATLAPLMVVFSRVVETGSFSGAARELGVTRAAVAKQVASLERALGAQLLRRTTRQMSLTEAGETLAAHSERLEREAVAGRDAVATMVGAPRGLLRVACPMSFALAHLARLVPEFALSHPEIQLDLVLDDAFVDLVADRFDVAIRVARLADSSLVSRRLAPSRQALCASPAYLAAAGVPRDVDDLREHDCLLYSLSNPPDLWRFRDGRSVRVRGRMTANNGEMLRSAACAGLGIAMLPTFIVGPEVAAGRLVPVLEDTCPGDLSICALTAPGRKAPPKVRAFLDFLASRLGPEPSWDEPFRHSATPPRAVAASTD
jgi:DNA-binding transcriptional LysR family regulator